MVYNTKEEIKFNICNSYEKIREAEEIVNKYPDININIYDIEYVSFPKKNTYFDYKFYLKKKQADKIYTTGLYYKLFSKKIPDSVDDSDKIKLNETAVLYFKDAILLVKDPDYLYQLQDLETNNSSCL